MNAEYCESRPPCPACRSEAMRWLNMHGLVVCSNVSCPQEPLQPWIWNAVSHSASPRPTSSVISGAPEKER